MKLLLIFVIVVAVLLALDFVWLGTTLEALYRPNMAGLIRDTPNLFAGAVFYVIYAFGLSYLIILPAVSGDHVNLMDMTIRAGLFGLVAFATYDMTGLSVIRGWSLMLSLIDMTWGTFAAGVSANLAVIGLRLLGQIR